MNHPYYNDIQVKFSKKKILAHQQAAITGHVSCLRDQAVSVSVVMGIVSLALIMIAWLAEDEPTVRIILTAISVAFFMIPLCPATIYWVEKKKYAFILDIESPKTQPGQMRCVQVKLWISRGKSGIGVIGVWLVSDTGEKYLYIYPHKCLDKVILTLFPENKVRKQIKAIFTGQFVRFSCYEGTNIIQGFTE
jgi:hypothetical protein